MIVAWMVYALGVSLAVLVSTGIVARLVRRWGRQERGVWAAGLATAVLVPLAQPFLRGRAVPESGTPDGGFAGFLGTPEVIGVAPPPPGSDPGSWLVATWAVLSLGLLAWLALGARRIQRERRAARGLGHTSDRVRISSTLGPGVTGFLAPAILLPSWLSELPAHCRRWVLRHEIAHLRGGDLPLRHMATAARVLFPWNPCIHALGRGLARALETDCDRRVLRNRPDPRGYGETLLAVAGRRPALAGALGTFDPRITSLRHRILTMTTPTDRLTPFRIALLGVVVPAAFVLACEVPSPTQTEPMPEAVPSQAQPLTVRDEQGEPVFTPFTVAPDITNRAAVVAKLQEEYPPLLREAGIGGTANVWFFITSEGVVEQVRIQQPSGHQALDQAALRVARVMEFTPALNRETPVDVWVAFPITFQTR